MAGALLASLATAANAGATTYYACVKKRGGALRIVAASTRCKRIERKISFNSTGVPGRNGRNGNNGRNGANGINGANGARGETGPAGSGATTFTTTVPQGTTATLATLGNGVVVSGVCNGGLKNVQLRLASASEFHLQASGTAAGDGTLQSVDIDNGVTETSTSGGATSADFDVLARDSTVGKFARIDVHGQFGSTCTFWGMIIPSG
jgi:hypothetical protein